MSRFPSVLIDARTALTGGGVTVLEAIDQHLIPTLSRMDVTVHRPGNGNRSLRNSPGLPLTLPGRRPDVVFGLSEASNLGAGGSSATIMLARNWNCWAPEVTLRRKVRSAVARANARRADVVVTATHAFADALREQLGAEKHIEVLPFGVREVFTPDGPVDEGSYFLCVGDWYPWKRFEVAVEAFARVADELPDSRLRIAGRPIHDTYVSSTLALATELGVADRVDILGSVDGVALASLYRGAIATVATSDLETFGHPYLESMASGTPLIGRSMEVTDELVGDHGILLRGSVDDFEKAMREVATTDHGLMTANALAHVAQFTWKNFAAGIHDLIAEAVD